MFLEVGVGSTYMQFIFMISFTKIKKKLEKLYSIIKLQIITIHQKNPACPDNFSEVKGKEKKTFHTKNICWPLHKQLSTLSKYETYMY